MQMEGGGGAVFQSDVMQLLLGSAAAEINSWTALQPRFEQRATAAPFTFTPHTIHLHKDDEFFEDGDVHRHLYLQDLTTVLANDAAAPLISEFQCHIAGCKQLFDTLEGYEHHYNSLHRHVCSSCKRSFPTNHLLDIHILEWHDSLFQVMAEKQCMYRCLVEGCELKFQTSKERKDHLITIHSYPSDFRFNKSKNPKRETKEKTNSQHKTFCKTVPANVLLQQSEAENCESMDFTLTQEPQSQGLTLSSQQKTQYSYRVPPSICFGKGSVRGFRGGRKK